MFLQYVKNMVILEIKYLYFQVHKKFFSIQNSVQPHFPPESHSTKTKSKYTTYSLISFKNGGKQLIKIKSKISFATYLLCGGSDLNRLLIITMC